MCFYSGYLIMKILSKWGLISFLYLGLITFSTAQSLVSKVIITGEMRNVMWKGQLKATISLDTISDKSNLYRFGPLDSLSGEIILLAGKSYQSSVLPDSSMVVLESDHLKAPFFAHSHIANWTEEILDEEIQSVFQLESYLESRMKGFSGPFMFKLTGIVRDATIHVMNLRRGTKVNSPDDAHKEKVTYQIKNQQIELLGFFSKEHKGIFTHHDSFLHMHLMTADKKKMGHLEELFFEKGKMKLFLGLKRD